MRRAIALASAPKALSDLRADWAAQPACVVLEHAGYRAWEVLGRLDAPTRAAIIAFWQEQQVLTAAEAARRVAEVCFVIRDPQDHLVGVSTLYPGELMHADHLEAVYFYRTYLQPRARGHVRLAVGLLEAARALLADPWRRPAATAIAFETNNPRLMTPAWRRLFTRRGWQRLGSSRRGRDVWWVRDR